MENILNRYSFSIFIFFNVARTVPTPFLFSGGKSSTKSHNLIFISASDENVIKL